MHSWGEWSWLRPGKASKWGKVGHSWRSQRWQIGRSLELWLGSRDYPSTCTALHWAPAPDPLALALLPSGEKMLLLGVYTLRENRTSLDPTLRASAIAPWDQTPTPDRAGTATENRRSPSSHLALALDPPPPVPTPTKMIAASTPWGEDVTCAHFKSSSPNKAMEHI